MLQRRQLAEEVAKADIEFPNDLLLELDRMEFFVYETGALRIFFEVREVPGLKKKPSTSELLDWLKLLLNEDITPEMLRERDPRKLIPPLHGALLKNEQDVHLFERLAFLSRREV
jgi:MoxR-like ATPase